MSVTTFGPRVLGRREDMQLTMQSLFLRGRILPVGARLWVRHEFQSNELQPVEVVYAFALPREATLRRFRISGDGFDVASDLRPKEEARRTYEDGIAQGSLSSLASIYGDGLTNLSVGNIRPKEKVVVLLKYSPESSCMTMACASGFPLLSRLAITPTHGLSKLSRGLAKWSYRSTISAM